MSAPQDYTSMKILPINTDNVLEELQSILVAFNNEMHTQYRLSNELLRGAYRAIL